LLRDFIQHCVATPQLDTDKEIVTPFINFCNERVSFYLQQLYPNIKSVTVIFENNVISAKLEGDINKLGEKGEQHNPVIAYTPNYAAYSDDSNYYILMEIPGLTDISTIKIHRTPATKYDTFAVQVNGTKQSLPALEPSKVVVDNRVFGNFDIRFEIPIDYFTSIQPEISVDSGIVTLKWKKMHSA